MECSRVVEVDDIDISVGRPDYKQLVLDIHRVDSLLAGKRGHRRSLPQVPISDGLVPRSCNYHRRIALRSFEEPYHADGSIVRGDLLGWSSIYGEIEKASGVVGTCTDDLLAVLSKGKKEWLDSGFSFSYGWRHAA